MSKLFNLLLLLLIFYSLSFAKETIKVCTPEWEGQTNNDGSGIYFEILKEVYEPLGIEVKHQIVPWLRAERLLKKGKSDIMCGDYYKSDKNDIYPKYPITIEILSVVYRKDLNLKWEGEKNLLNKDVVWIRGYNYHENISYKMNWTEVNTTDEGINAVLNKRVKFLLDDGIDIINKLEKKDEIRNKLEVKEIFREKLFLRYSNNEKGKRYSKLFDERMEELLKTDKIKKIFEKWDIEYPDLSPMK